MGIWDNIINGAKGIFGNIEGNPIVKTPQIAIQPQNNNALQAGAAVVNGVNGDNVQPQQSTNMANKIANVLQNSPLRPTNWNGNTREAIANTLLGIGKSALANPNGNVLNNVLNGVNSGVQNQIAYKNAMNTLGNYGVDTTGMSPYADYSNFSPDKLVALGVQQNRNKIRQDIAAANDNTKRLKLILDGLKNNTISPEEAIAQAKIYGIDFNNLQESNETARTNSQVKVNEARAEDIKNPKPRTTINIRKGGTKSTVDITHTGGGNGKGKGNANDPLDLWK